MSSPPGGIDATSVPRVKASAAMVELDGEGVVLDGDTRRLHLLNPVATVVWGCLDGTASVEELASELAESFGAPPDTVRDDVVALVGQLAAAGLLEGTAAPATGYPGPIVGGQPEGGGET